MLCKAILTHRVRMFIGVFPEICAIVFSMRVFLLDYPDNRDPSSQTSAAKRPVTGSRR